MVNSTLGVVHDQGDFGILKKDPASTFFASNLKEESEFSHLSSKLEISPQEKVY